MSDYPLTSSGGATSGEGATSTADTAKEQARSVAADVKGQTSDVASHAAEETMQVVDQAKNQAMDLLMQSRSQLAEQANTQQQRLAQGLRSLGEELSEMAGGSSSSGLAGQAATQLSSRVSQAADFLEQRDVSGVVDELSNYARRRPGVFLLGSTLLGVVAGRVTRGLQAGSSSSSSPSSSSSFETGAADDVAGVSQVSGPSTTYITSGEPTAYGSATQGPLGAGYGTASEVTPPPVSDPLAYPPGEGERRTL